MFFIDNKLFYYITYPLDWLSCGLMNWWYLTGWIVTILVVSQIYLYYLTETNIFTLLMKGL